MNKTRLGNFQTVSAEMKNASGYGQYKITVHGIYEGNKVAINAHSTDSQLFDTLADFDSNAERSEYLLTDRNYTILRMIEDYVSSL